MALLTVACSAALHLPTMSEPLSSLAITGLLGVFSLATGSGTHTELANAGVSIVVTGHIPHVGLIQVKMPTVVIRLDFISVTKTQPLGPMLGPHMWSPDPTLTVAVDS